MTTTVLMPVGIPGIGKSTLIAQQIGGRANVEISRDAARSKINGGDATFIPKNEGLVSELVFQRFNKALDASAQQTGPNVITLDMTNIDKRSRQDYLKILKEFIQKNDLLLKIFHFPNSVDLSMQRQEGRIRKVERDIVQKYADRFERYSASEMPESKKLAVEVYDVKQDGTLLQQALRFGQRLLMK